MTDNNIEIIDEYYKEIDLDDFIFDNDANQNRLKEMFEIGQQNYAEYQKQYDEKTAEIFNISVEEVEKINQTKRSEPVAKG